MQRATARNPVAQLVAELADDGIAVLGEEPPRQLRACLAPSCEFFFAKDHHRQE